MVEKYQITKKEEVYKILKNKRNFEYMSEALLRSLIDHMKVVRFTDETNSDAVDLLDSEPLDETKMVCGYVKNRAAF